MKSFKEWLAERQAIEDRKDQVQKDLVEMGTDVRTHYERETAIGTQPLGNGVSLTSEDGRRLDVHSEDGEAFCLVWYPGIVRSAPQDKRDGQNIDQVYEAITAFIDHG